MRLGRDGALNGSDISWNLQLTLVALAPALVPLLTQPGRSIEPRDLLGIKQERSVSKADALPLEL